MNTFRLNITGQGTDPSQEDAVESPQFAQTSEGNSEVREANEQEGKLNLNIVIRHGMKVFCLIIFRTRATSLRKCCGTSGCHPYFFRSKGRTSAAQTLKA